MTRDNSPPMLALSVRQPWAELIMRGKKVVEQRSRPTNVRGRIYIYASLGRYKLAEENEWAEQYGLDVEGLPRGVIVGTVELYDCYGDEWYLRGAERLAKCYRPTARAQPVWFRPFEGA